MNKLKVRVDDDGYFDAQLAAIYTNREYHKSDELIIEIDPVQPKRLPQGMTQIIISGGAPLDEFLQMAESVQEGRKARTEC